MPTVVKWLPSSKPGSRRRLSDSFSESTIRRSAEANCVKMNAVVKQAAREPQIPTKNIRLAPAEAAPLARPQTSAEPRPPRTASIARRATADADPTPPPLSQSRHTHPLRDRSAMSSAESSRSLFVLWAFNVPRGSLGVSTSAAGLVKPQASHRLLAGSCRLPTLPAFSRGRQNRANPLQSKVCIGKSRDRRKSSGRHRPCRRRFCLQGIRMSQAEVERPAVARRSIARRKVLPSPNCPHRHCTTSA